VDVCLNFMVTEDEKQFGCLRKTRAAEDRKTEGGGSSAVQEVVSREQGAITPKGHAVKAAAEAKDQAEGSARTKRKRSNSRPRERKRVHFAKMGYSARRPALKKRKQH
jgi:hypothetical protein